MLKAVKAEANKKFRERSNMVKIMGYEIKLCSRYDRARQLGSKKSLTLFLGAFLEMLQRSDVNFKSLV